MGRDQEGVIARSRMMKRGRETENLQGQMYMVCCSYQDQILSRKNMLFYIFPLFQLAGVFVREREWSRIGFCVCQEVRRFLRVTSGLDHDFVILLNVWFLPYISSHYILDVHWQFRMARDRWELESLSWFPVDKDPQCFFSMRCIFHRTLWAEEFLSLCLSPRATFITLYQLLLCNVLIFSLNGSVFLSLSCQSQHHDPHRRCVEMFAYTHKIYTAWMLIFKHTAAKQNKRPFWNYFQFCWIC